MHRFIFGEMIEREKWIHRDTNGMEERAKSREKNEHEQLNKTLKIN